MLGSTPRWIATSQIVAIGNLSELKPSPAGSAALWLQVDFQLLSHICSSENMTILSWSIELSKINMIKMAETCEQYQAVLKTTGGTSPNPMDVNCSHPSHTRIC